MKFGVMRPCGAIGILALACATSACTGDPKGQLMVAVQTDMSVPDDINTLRIEVRSLGGQIARVDNEIRPFSSGGIFMPGTLGLLEGDTKSQQVEIRISSKFKFESSGYTYEEGEDDRDPEGIFRTLREVRTQLPVGKVVSLPVPIQWLCSEDPDTPDSEREYLTQVGDDPRNACPDGRTCISGTCQRNEVDVNDLDEFDPNDVGSGGGDGTCFDTLGCFENAQLVQPDMDGCTLSVSSTDDLNIALYTGVRAGGGGDGAGADAPDAGVPEATDVGMDVATSGAGGSTAEQPSIAEGGSADRARDTGDDPAATAPAPNFKGTSETPSTPTSVGGVCYDDGLCLVPLDKDEDTGWTEGSGSREVVLPEAVCRRIEQGRVQGIAISNDCESKTPSSPTCGDWLEGGGGSRGRNSPSALISTNRPAGFVDDLADGDTQFQLLSGEQGRWISGTNGAAGEPEVVMDEDSERGNVVRFSGTLDEDQESGDSADNATFVGLLLDVGQDDETTDFDASEFAGISFYAKGSRDGERLLVAAPPTALVSEEYGGTCTEDCEIPVGYTIRLTTEWRLYTVTWDQLFQRGETYGEETISGMQFFPQDAGDFELYLDDMSLLDPDDVPGSQIEVCDVEALATEFFTDLDALRECDPDAQDPCDIEVTFDGETFLYVTDDGLESRAQDIYDAFVSTIEVCAPEEDLSGAMGVANGGDGEVFPHCIPTGDGMGVCSAVDSPYFTDPEPFITPIDTCTLTIEDDLVDDFESGDNTAASGGEWSFQYISGGETPVVPTTNAAVMGSYGLYVPDAELAGIVPFDPDCIGDLDDFVGIGFYARSDTEVSELLIGLGGPENTSMDDHPAGTCTLETGQCPLGSGFTVELFSDWRYYEIPFTSFVVPDDIQSRLDTLNVVAALFLSLDSGFYIDQIVLLDEITLGCGDDILDEANEECDDGNLEDGDGCSSNCTIESVIVMTCGNGTVEGNETCDDGNSFGQDGCSDLCQIELGYDCPNPGFQCTPCGGQQQTCCGEGTGQSTSGGPCAQGLTCDVENFCAAQVTTCTVNDGQQGECAAGNVCYFGSCYPCGTDGNLCCEFSTCSEVDTVCADSFGNPPSVWSDQAYCQQCGASGEPCCADSVCDAGLFCDGLCFGP